MKLTPETCQRKGCTKPTEWVPVLMFRAHVAYKNDVPAPSYLFGIGVCSEHRPLMNVEDLLSDEGWKTVKSVFLRAGRAVPDRSRTTIEFITTAQAAEVAEEYRRAGGA